MCAVTSAPHSVLSRHAWTNSTEHLSNIKHQFVRSCTPSTVLQYCTTCKKKPYGSAAKYTTKLEGRRTNRGGRLTWPGKGARFKENTVISRLHVQVGTKKFGRRAERDVQVKIIFRITPCKEFWMRLYQWDVQTSGTYNWETYNWDSTVFWNLTPEFWMTWSHLLLFLCDLTLIWPWSSTVWLQNLTFAVK